MPFSSTLFKEEIKNHILDSTKLCSRILDVGPGCGTYGMLLNKDRKIDAIEIYEPYIERFSLNNIYDNIHIQDICTFDFHEYDYIILGDVLEHIPIEDAIPLIDRINALAKRCLVAVPYLYEQGEWEGNVYETHHQPDLTQKLMSSRYPSLKLLFGNQDYGYYVNY